MSERPDSSLELPLLPYAGTSGWSGSDASRERAEHLDSSGVTSRRQRGVLHMMYLFGPSGVTWVDVAEQQSIHHGSASGLLSVLHKERRIERLTLKRNGSSVYVLPEYVEGRETSPHKSHLAPARPSTEFFIQTLEDIRYDLESGNSARALFRVRTCLEKLDQQL